MPLRHVLLALLVVAIWGFNFVVIKWSVEAMPPVLAAALRFAAAAVPAVFFLPPPKTSARLVIGYGLAFGFALYALLNLAIAWGMPAGLSSLLMQTQAFFTMAIAFLLLGERPTRFQVIGAIIAFSGIGIIALERLDGAGAVPLLLLLLGAASWGLANVLTRKAGRVDAVSFTAWGSLAAAVPLLLFALVVDGSDAVFAAFRAFSWSDAALIAFMAYPGTLLGGGIWSWLLGRHPATTVAPFTLLVPITGLLSTYLVFGETITPIEIAGGLLVIFGLVVTLIRLRPSAPGLRLK